MLQNTVKDDIKNALERAGYNPRSANVELIYQIYMSGSGGGNFGRLIKEHSSLLKK